jgi:hypothetical protein
MILGNIAAQYFAAAELGVWSWFGRVGPESALEQWVTHHSSHF